MASDNEMEIYKQHRASQDKYVYFLLAAAGASIAFALNQTKGLPLSTSQMPLALAIAAWGLSFTAGCARVAAVDLMLNLNQDLLRIQTGQHELLSHPNEIPVAIASVKEMLERANRRSVRSLKWQYRFLICGAVSYIGWHIYEMYLRSQP